MQSAPRRAPIAVDAPDFAARMATGSRTGGRAASGIPRIACALRPGTVLAMHAFGVSTVVERLRDAGGGYEIVHESPGLEVGVYVLVAPEADRQQPHADDEIYIGLEGTGV